MLQISCQNEGIKSVPKPSGLLSRIEMAMVLSDMHLANAGLEASSLSADSLKRSLAGYDQFIYQKHGTNAADFIASYDYYLSIPTEMDSIYLILVDSLNARESKSRGIQIIPITPSK